MSFFDKSIGRIGCWLTEHTWSSWRYNYGFTKKERECLYCHKIEVRNA